MKPKYETPKTIDFLEYEYAQGVCNAGDNTDIHCQNGVQTNKTCGTGGTAGSGCDPTGNSPSEPPCTTGSAAIGCTSGTSA